MPERFGPGLPGGVHPPEGLFGRRGREIAVEPEMIPYVAVIPQLFAGDGSGIGVTRIAAAIDSGLNRMPEGFAVTRNFAPASFSAMCAAKHEPSVSTRFS